MGNKPPYIIFMVKYEVCQMRNKRFDERKWKPFIVGVIVFAVVFFGLVLYQQASERTKGDVIVTGGENAGQTDEGGSREGSSDNVESAAGGKEEIAIFVDVSGAVNLSGLFALPAGSRIADALEAAGGLTEEAEIKYINRAYALSDGERIYVPTKAEVLAGTAPPTAGQVAAAGSATAGTPTGAQNSAAAVLVNINTAGSEELQKLSGVGPVTARKIIDYREKRGVFKRIEDLMNVSGIGSKTFARLRDYITV